MCSKNCTSPKTTDCLLFGTLNGFIQSSVKQTHALNADTTQRIDLKARIYRGYYTAARRYEFYFRVVKAIFYERAQRVSKILFFTTRK